MFHNQSKYAYFEEINEGVLSQLPRISGNENKRVLDVGCGMATLGEAIEAKGYSVYGIENNEEAFSIASNRITKVVNADLNDFCLLKKMLENNSFDYIIFSDVLEHIYDPLSTLKRYLCFLKSDGIIIISVPNVAVWQNRLGLLFGRFQYEDSGVLDKTHIRFFTFKTAYDMLRYSGLILTKIDYTPYIIRAFLPLLKKILQKRETPKDRRSIIDLPAYRFYLSFIYPFEYWFGILFKSFFGFRIILVGKKS